MSICARTSELRRAAFGLSRLREGYIAYIVTFLVLVPRSGRPA